MGQVLYPLGWPLLILGVVGLVLAAFATDGRYRAPGGITGPLVMIAVGIVLLLVPIPA